MAESSTPHRLLDCLVVSDNVTIRVWNVMPHEACNLLTGSAAKLAQVGFTETLAKEGFRYNIICNVIAPIGNTRHFKHLRECGILTEE